MSRRKKISVIVPVHNESLSIKPLLSELRKALQPLPYNYEIIFIDDGSRDDSVAVIRKVIEKDKHVHLVELVRNFGKEAAISAGLHEATGDAAVMLDADLQHPPKLLKDFIAKWEQGAEVVVGIREYAQDESRFKRFASNLFYRLMRAVAHTVIIPHATDYRLLDRTVINAFNDMTERNRITRGLIDWLGFKREYVHFVAPLRQFGEASYTFRKLVTLAVNSFTAYSLLPLKLAGYLGILILVVSAPLGLFAFVERFILGDPLGLRISGTAFLGIMLLFLSGVILACMGMIALYIAHIHTEVINRPLYVSRPIFGRTNEPETEAQNG